MLINNYKKILIYRRKRYFGHNFKYLHKFAMKTTNFNIKGRMLKNCVEKT